MCTDLLQDVQQENGAEGNNRQCSISATEISKEVHGSVHPYISLVFIRLQDKIFKYEVRKPTLSKHCSKFSFCIPRKIFYDVLRSKQKGTGQQVIGPHYDQTRDKEFRIIFRDVTRSLPLYRKANSACPFSVNYDMLRQGKLQDCKRTQLSEDKFPISVSLKDILSVPDEIQVPGGCRSGLLQSLIVLVLFLHAPALGRLHAALWVTSKRASYMFAISVTQLPCRFFSMYPVSQMLRSQFDIGDHKGAAT